MLRALVTLSKALPMVPGTLCVTLGKPLPLLLQMEINSASLYPVRMQEATTQISWLKTPKVQFVPHSHSSSRALLVTGNRRKERGGKSFIHWLLKLPPKGTRTILLTLH